MRKGFSIFPRAGFSGFVRWMKTLYFMAKTARIECVATAGRKIRLV